MQIAASQPETGVSHQAGAFHRSGKPGRRMLYLQEAGAAYIALRGSISYGTMITVMQRMGRTMSEENYTYILECADGTLYCGWTNHLQERVAAHNAGKGARYTKSRRPVVLKYYETFSTKQEAMRREWAVKQLSRKEKLELIEAFTQRMRTS